MTLEQATRMAQAAANRSGAPRAVLNFNTVGAALYVVRDVPPPEAVARNGPRWLVAVVQPEAPEA